MIDCDAVAPLASVTVAVIVCTPRPNVRLTLSPVASTVEPTDHATVAGSVAFDNVADRAAVACPKLLATSVSGPLRVSKIGGPNFATNTSRPPPEAGCSALCVGKSFDSVEPLT